MHPVLRRAAIALGSNLGGREEHLAHAVARLAADPDLRLLAVSEWIETAPVGGPAGQGAYLNGACVVETTLDPLELLERLHAIERERGRDRAREVRNGPRTLDLDLILCGELVRDDERLVLPHPRYAQRDFVLRPLAQVGGDLVDPLRGASVRELLARLSSETAR